MLAFAFQRLPAQFNGILYYENDYSDKWFGTKGKVLTTIYESGPHARIESRDTSFSGKGVTTQNPLLIDLSKGTITHLIPKAHRAMVVSISAWEKMNQKANDEAHAVYDLENAGQEKIGQFSCAHFVLTKSYAKLKTLKPAHYDIWITKDLGSSNIRYIGGYLYLYGGMDLYTKLANAGGNGVVVKWQFQETGSSATTCMLMSYKKESLPATLFSTPANYTIVNAPNFP